MIDNFDMVKKVTVIILASLFSLVAVSNAAVRQALLRDGFVLAGVDGKLMHTGDKWFFRLESDASNVKTNVRAGTNLELLTCSAMEKITESKDSIGKSYRLWGRVTNYRKRNFIFAVYFIPLSAEKSGQQQSQPTGRKSRPVINEPNDELALPEEIVSKLTERRMVIPEPPQEPLVLKLDSILAGRTGYITRKNSQTVFVIEGLGRDIAEDRLMLLKCQALQYAEDKQSDEADTVRFRIGGIVTRYKQRNYLLPQTVTRVYSHGNF